MSKPSYLGSNVVSTDSFSGWIDKTNQVRYDMGTVVVTVGSVPQPNATNGAETSGNAHVDGIMSATTYAVAGDLRGGTVSTPGDLTISSNVIYNDSALIQVDANTELFSIDANNMVISSNVVFDGLTKTIDVSTAGLNVLVGDVSIATNLTSSANVTFDGTTFTATTNASFTAAAFESYATTTTIGANNTAFDLVVNAHTTLANTDVTGFMDVQADAQFSANTEFRGRVDIGDASSDQLHINSRLHTDLIPVSTQSLGTNANPFANLHVTDVLADADVEARGEFRIRKGATGVVRHTSTDTSYQELDVRLETSVGNAVTPVTFFGDMSGAGIKGSANVAQDLGTPDTYWQNGYIATVESDTINNSGIANISGALNVTGISTLSANVVMQDRLTVTNQSTFQDVVRVDGASFLNGTVYLGSDNTDSIYFLGEVNTDVVPNVNDTYDLGSVSRNWAQGHFTTLNSVNSNVSGPLDVDGTSTLADVIVTAGMDVTGAVEFNDAVTLGQSSVDQVIFKGRVDSTLLPFADATYSIGTDSARWLNLKLSGNMIADGTATLGSSLVLESDGTRVIRTLSTDATKQALQFQLRDNLADTAIPLVLKETGAAPDVNNTFDLGENTKRWKTLYAVTGEIDTVNATDVIAGNDVTVNGNLTVLGDTTLSTNSTLSLETSDIVSLDVLDTLTMSLGAGVDSDFNPDIDSTYDLGSNAVRWQHVYADTLHGNLAWSEITSKPDPTVTVTLTGDVAGSGSTTLTDLANGDITFATTVQPNSVALGADTTGNYVETVAPGSGVTSVQSGAGDNKTFTVSHAATGGGSDIAINNSGGTVLQDLTVTLDSFGHVETSTATSVNLDLRYSQDTFVSVGADTGTIAATTLTDSFNIVGGSGIDTSASGSNVTVAVTDGLDEILTRGSSTAQAMTVGALTVNGDLDVQGTINKLSTTEIDFEDTFIVLNSTLTGAATENVGIEVNRGSGADRRLRWNESADRWQFQSGDGVYYNIPLTSEYNNYAWNLSVGGTDRGAISNNERVNLVGGTNISAAYSSGNNTITFNHSDTSSLSGDYGQTGTQNGTYIKSVTVDGRGHMTAVTSGSFDTRYLQLTAKAADSTLFDGLTTATFLRNNVAANISAHQEWQDDFAVRLGAGADMRMYHSGGVNYFDLHNSSDLKIRSNTSDRITFTRSNGNITTIGDVNAANINPTGLVDGRNIATDGTKLDGIESGATGDQTASEILSLLKTVDGSGSGLDSEFLGGNDVAFFRNAGNLNAGTISDARLPSTITSSITGNAATATKLATARNIAVSGAVSGSASFDGSSNITISTSLDKSFDGGFTIGGTGVGLTTTETAYPLESRRNDDMWWEMYNSGGSRLFARAGWDNSEEAFRIRVLEDNDSQISAHSLYVGRHDVTIAGTDLDSPDANSVMTRERGDARYPRQWTGTFEIEIRDSSTPGGGNVSSTKPTGTFVRTGNVMFIQFNAANINTSALNNGNMYFHASETSSTGMFDINATGEAHLMCQINRLIGVGEIHSVGFECSGSTWQVWTAGIGQDNLILNSENLVNGQSDIRVSGTYQV